MTNDGLNLIHPKTFNKPLCAEVGATFFYIDDDDDETINIETANVSYQVALEVCKKCIHISDCAEWGIRKERWGVWGGLTPPQRSEIRRKKKITLKEAQQNAFMAAEPVFIPVPVCEVCWLIEHTVWEPESMDSTGRILMRLTGVDVPEKVNTESVDVCSDCGSITISGIYEMRDPATIKNLDYDEYGYENDDPTQFTFSLNPEYEDGQDDFNE